MEASLLHQSHGLRWLNLSNKWIQSIPLLLGPPIHFINMLGPLNTYKKVFGILYMPWMVIRVILTCMVTTRTLAVSHIWGTSHIVMLGYYWGLLSTSYTYQIHFIHIKVVWHSLYDVDSHQNAPHTVWPLPGLSCAVCHIWVLTTLFGCDWDLLSTS